MKQIQQTGRATIKAVKPGIDITMTFPFVRLKHMIIDAETHDFGQVERFLTYAGNNIAQSYFGSM